MARVEDVAKYIIDIFQTKAERNLDDGMTNLRLQKLLYLVQGYYLATYRKPLFSDEIEAWKYGPVVPAMYAKYSKFNRNCIRENPPEENTISDEESELILNVLSKFGKYSTGYLVDLSHAPGAPWAQVYSEERKNKIPKESIEKYFTERMKTDPVGVEKRLQRIERHQTRGKEGHILLPASEYEDWEKYANV